MQKLSSTERVAAVTARELLYGQLAGRALAAAAELGIPALLAERPSTTADLAERVGADAGSVGRLMRALAVFDVFAEDETGAYALTPLGAALTPDHPASALPSALLVAGEFGAAWDRLVRTVRSGRSPFLDDHGTDPFTLMESPGGARLRATFDSSQRFGLALELDEIMRHVDFSGYRTVVDIGGGDGAFIRRVLDAHPDVRGVLFDLPGSVARADEPAGRAPAGREEGRARAREERLSVVAGDFFEQVPEGGDLYLLSHILHDWDDENAVRILRTCRRAMAPAATLMVVDLTAADGGDRGPESRAAALMDLYMLSLFGGGGGQERTAAEVRALLAKARLRVSGTHALPSGMQVISAVPED